jgi:hypothetical protein
VEQGTAFFPALCLVRFPDGVTLRAGSPAVNAADPNADYSKEPGYNGGRADLGAFGNTWEATEQPPLEQMGVTLDAGILQQAGRPGQVVTFTFSLTNSGSVSSTYTLTLLDANSSFRSSLFEDGQRAPWSVKLTPQESISMTVWVELPLDFTRGVTNTTRVIAYNGYGVGADLELFTQLAAFQQVGGQVVMEAEHFVEDIARSERAWFTQTVLGGYVGPGYLSALPDTDFQFGAGHSTTSPEVMYTLNLTVTGVYTVWLRGYAPNAAGDSIYVGLDGHPAVTLTGFVPRRWSWAGLNAQGGAVTIEIDQPGLHTLHVWQREDGLRLDRILISTESDYIPLGDGPPESEFR